MFEIILKMFFFFFFVVFYENIRHPIFKIYQKNGVPFLNITYVGPPPNLTVLHQKRYTSPTLALL